jgi:gamma-glutamyltranspeptidase/glutathione hydrolase
MEQGGNAVDAGVAMVFAQAVLEPDNFGIGGEVPILIYSTKDHKVHAISGQGVAPKAATIEWFKSHGISKIPGDGFLPAVVPAVIDALALALEQYGTMTLDQVMQPAINLAESGFPLYPVLQRSIRNQAKRFREEWPSSAEVFLTGGEILEVGDLLIQKELAHTFRRIVNGETQSRAEGRSAAIRAGRNVFYKGGVAREIVKFQRETRLKDKSGYVSNGLLSEEDLATYQGHVEEAVTVNYRGIDVYKVGPWAQSPVFLQQLNLLEGFDLKAMGHNTPDYVHTVVEASKLAFSDREAYYGDPNFVKVPLRGLLSKQYAAERRKLISPRHASLELRPGNPFPFEDTQGPQPTAMLGPVEFGPEDHGTTGTRAVDAQGNMFSATPSGGWIHSSPVIVGLGFPLGTRGQIFWLDPSKPNCLQPGKRPRTTLTPSLALKQGKPHMVWGTPGGDYQDQWTLQFFLNVVDFGMSLQEAIDAPNFHSLHFPSSFYPRDAKPGELAVEARLDPSVLEKLEERGHIIRLTGPWSGGEVTAIQFDPHRKIILGAASSRHDKPYALGW